MATERSCDACGKTYVAKRKTSRYCSSLCRTRSSRAGQGRPGAVLVLPDLGPQLGKVEAATSKALEDAGRLDTYLGASCLVLARRLDNPMTDTGSAMATVQRQLQSAMAEATKGTAAATAPQRLRDELAARRERQA